MIWAGIGGLSFVAIGYTTRLEGGCMKSVGIGFMIQLENGWVRGLDKYL